MFCHLLTNRSFTSIRLAAAGLFLAVGANVASAQAPTAAYALGLTPIQEGVDFGRPTKEETEKCTIKMEDGGATWVVRDPLGRVLRRFSDTDKNDVVDQWSYFKDGLEVYRDVDSNNDGKADQYRWFQGGGTRWAIDKNQDGTVDAWRMISAHEVVEELVSAIQRKDQRAFAALLLSSSELKNLGASPSLNKQFGESLADAPSQFKELIQKQKAITPDSRFADFGASRPGVVPAQTDGSTKDLMVYEGVSALVDTGSKPQQLQVGILVRVGDSWRLVEAPQLTDGEVDMTTVFSVARTTTPNGFSAPSDKVQELMTKLEKLDAQRTTVAEKDKGKLVQQRAGLLRQLAGESQSGEMRDQWYNQLADMLSAAVLEGTYPDGVKELAKLDSELAKAKASEDVQAHVTFQRIWTDWSVRSQDPKQDYAKIQERWLKQLQSFVKKYPNSNDAAEAYLQLGMADEFAGKTEEASKWYETLSKDYSSSIRGRKGQGALRRLNSAGKPMRLRGNALGGGQIDLAGYKGKLVVIQYWATWCEPCKSDMAQLKELNAKYGGRGFTVLGVNLDNSASTALEFLSKNRLPWKQAHDEGGLESRLATEMGVMTLPLMILVDQKGNVVDRDIQVAELDGELKKLLK